MAIRVRRDGSMWCAAHTVRRPGDRYIDDRLHYRLSVELGLIASLPMPCHVIYPRWWRVSRKQAGEPRRPLTEEREMADHRKVTYAKALRAWNRYGGGDPNWKPRHQAFGLTEEEAEEVRRDPKKFADQLDD